MADRHKSAPVRLREADRLWLEAHAAKTGQSLGDVLAQAIAEYRKRAERQARSAARGG